MVKFFSPFLLTLVLAWHPCVQAKESACPNKIYRMLVHDFHASMNEGKLSAITKILGTLLEEETGCKIRHQKSTVLQGLREMQNHRTDMFATMPPTPEWDKSAVLLPIWKVQRVLVVKKSNNMPSTVEKILQDESYRLGVQTGVTFFFHPEEIKKLREQKRITDGASLNSVLNLFKANKVDAFFAPPSAIETIEKRLNAKQEFVIIGDPSFVLQIGFYMSKTRLSEEERRRFSDAIGRLHKRGAIKEVFASSLRKNLLQYYSF